MFFLGLSDHSYVIRAFYNISVIWSAFHSRYFIYFSQLQIMRDYFKLAPNGSTNWEFGGRAKDFLIRCLGRELSSIPWMNSKPHQWIACKQGAGRDYAMIPTRVSMGLASFLLLVFTSSFTDY